MNMTYTELYNKVLEHIGNENISRNKNEIILDKLAKTDLVELASYCNMLLDHNDQRDFITEADDTDSVVNNLYKLNTAIFFEPGMHAEVTDALNDLLIKYHLNEENPNGLMEVIKHCYRDIDHEKYLDSLSEQYYPTYTGMYS